jgi:hypothetical protein
MKTTIDIAVQPVEAKAARSTAPSDGRGDAPASHRPEDWRR